MWGWTFWWVAFGAGEIPEASLTFVCLPFLSGPREPSTASGAAPAGEDRHNLHPGALLYRAAAAPPSLPTMTDALAHGADVNWVNVAQESRTPLLQAVAAVSLVGGQAGGGQFNTPAPFLTTFSLFLPRIRCWPVNSCCKTEPASTKLTARGGGPCTTPPSWGTRGT